MEKTIEIPEGYEARIEGNKVILKQKKSEDEKIRKELINQFSLISEMWFRNIFNGQFTKEQILAYLERQKEQKPAGWSEEDRDFFDSIIDKIEINIDKCGLSSSEFSWLKSLRPQPHWKPSEEQMGWLESATRLSTDKPHIHGIIISLYEQLKRL